MPQSSEHTLAGRRPSQRDPLLGTWLDDRYLIEERIATGGFGAIYRARTAGGMALALKVLHPSLTGDPNMVARFRREGATLTQLHDPHTVTTLAAGETRDGTLYIAMELLGGESLHARLERERALPWQAAVAIARAVCSSLAEAHALGVVHRDLKPDNIHVERRAGAELVKVIDFGIVKIAPGSAVDDGRELTCAGHMIGTYDYMSPEQIAGEPCEAASDIYSLGVVLYEMLTGRRPFSKIATPAAMMTALLIQTPLPPSVFVALPPALDRIVMRCLEREPEQRFAGVGELAAALARLLAQPPSARDEITAVHPVWSPRPSPSPSLSPSASLGPAEPATLRDLAFLRSHAGEDAAICRDLGATLIDHDRTWTEPAMSEANRRGGSMACGTGRVERSPAAALSATLPGLAVATSRGSRPRIAEHPRPSASAMLAPAIPPAPIVRPSASSLPAVPSRPPSAALLIAAALAAGVTTFLLATLL